MSDPNTAFPEYAKPAPLLVPFLVTFLTMYGALSVIGDIAHILWKIAQ